jgi:hypothetical protein
MRKRICPFCGKYPPEIIFSLEHVLPAWLGKKMSSNEKRLIVSQWFALNADDSPDRISEIRSISPYDQKVSVCKTCNEGWMEGKVEAPVQEDLPRLASSKRLIVDEKCAKKLALWAAKTSCTRALMDKGERVIPVEHYRFLYKELKPPPYTMIWAIPCSVGSTLTRHYRFKSLFNNPTLHVHITTLKFGSLALFVLGFSNGMKDHVFANVDDHVHNQSGSAAVRLWPDSKEFNWSGEGRMDESQILQLTDTTISLLTAILSDPRRPSF